MHLLIKVPITCKYIHMIRNNLLSIFIVTLSSFSMYYDKVNALDWEELKDYIRAKLQIEVTNQVGLKEMENKHTNVCLLYTSPSPRD